MRCAKEQQEALGEIGPAAKDAVPSLILALTADYESVRKEAAGALTKIGLAAKDIVPRPHPCLDG